METNTTGAAGGANPANAGGASEGSQGQGNSQLSQAFDQAIEQAQQTLEITTKRGADLYALKQSVR